MGRPASSASAVETSSAAEELSPEPSGTVLRISRLAGSMGTARAQQFLRDADHVVGPVVLRAPARRTSASGQSRSLPAVFGVDAQLAVARGRGAAIAGRQVQRHRQHEAEVVIGVLADQVDAAGRAVDTQAAGGAEALRGMPRSSRAWASGRARPAPAGTPPNASMNRPQYRLTLTSVSGARAVRRRTRPTPIRITPMSVKNKPEGTRRSSIVYQNKIFRSTSSTRHQRSPAARALIPGHALVVRDLGEPVDQAVQFRLRPGPR